MTGIQFPKQDYVTKISLLSEIFLSILSMLRDDGKIAE
jgi:hypothetical protein